MDDNGGRRSSLSEKRSDNAEGRKQELLDFAKKRLKDARPCISELEALLEALTPKVKSIQSTGLIPFIRDLKNDIEGIECIITDLLQMYPENSSGAGDQHVPEVMPDGEAHTTMQNLDAVWKRLEPRTTGAYHGSMRWQALKRCDSLVAVKHTFQGADRADRLSALSRHSPRTEHERQHLHRVLKVQGKTEVAIVDRGAQWIDFRWISVDRLARQMTDSGWAWGDYGLGDTVDKDEWEDAPFVKQVRRVVAAARLNRYEYKIPKVRLLLPNLSRGVDEDVDILLEQLTTMDPGVDLLVEDATSLFFTGPPPCLEDAIRNLVGNSLQVLTETLNLEHTVLVDLISDLTHLHLQPQLWHSRTTRDQIEEENKHPDGIMAPTLYPLLQARRLVCTYEAAEHFHEMLTTVGTPVERERGRLLVPIFSPERDEPEVDLRARFNALSERPLPDAVQFPVAILPSGVRWDVDLVQRFVEAEQLPPVALAIVRKNLLRSSRLSTYMHGWIEGIVTITSNKEINAHMKTWVEAGRQRDDERGPQLYCVQVTRNLLAKSARPPTGWVRPEPAT